MLNRNVLWVIIMCNEDKPCEFSDGNLNEINRTCTHRNKNCTYNTRDNCDIYPIQKEDETRYLERTKELDQK